MLTERATTRNSAFVVFDSFVIICQHHLFVVSTVIANCSACSSRTVANCSACSSRTADVIIATVSIIR
jgi:hypothetical protein